MINTITFTAKYLNSSKVQKINPNKTLSEATISLVEMSPYDANDVSAIKKVAKDWYQGDLYCETIAEHMDIDEYENPLKRFFALTLQGKNHDKLNPAKILAVMQTGDKKNNELYVDYLQVSPLHKHGSPKREYLGVGKTALNLIKQYFSDRRISYISDYNVIEFHRAVGIEEVFDGVFRLK